jgi:hypothetical protein
MAVLHLPISEENLAKLEEEGDFAFFVALSLNGYDKVVQVHLRHRKVYDLIHARGGVQSERGGTEHPPLIQGAILEREK